MKKYKSVQECLEGYKKDNDELFDFADQNDWENLLAYLENSDTIDDKVLLGCLLIFNPRVRRRDNKGFELIKNAAELGSIVGQYRLGECLNFGIKTEENKQEAIKWLLLSANKGFVKAQCLLAGCYDDLDNQKEAFKWYKIAAENGDMGAMASLSLFYEYGEGCEINKKEAFRLRKICADAGYKNSQAQLGLMYLNGFGTPVNKEEGIKYLIMAAIQKESFAIDKLQELGIDFVYSEEDEED